MSQCKGVHHLHATYFDVVSCTQALNEQVFSPEFAIVHCSTKGGKYKDALSADP